MFLQQLFNGLVLGLTISLIALGFSFVKGVLKVTNFAHGNVYAVGAFIGLSGALLFKGNFVAGLVSALIGSACLGIIMERTLFRPVRFKPPIAGFLTSTGAIYVLNIFIIVVWGASPEAYAMNLPNNTWHLGSVVVSSMQVLMLVTAIAAMVVLWLIVDKTFIGTAMRATSQSAATAELMGIDVKYVMTFTLAISAALAGLGGVLVCEYYGMISPTIGYEAGINAYVAAIVGGVGSIPGALLGGIIIGITEALAAGYISPGYQDAIAFAMLILILLVRPSGLLGRDIAQKM